MNILIISNSVIVYELIKLVLDEHNIEDVEYTSNVEDTKQDSYNIIFIDDSVADLDKDIEYILNNLSYGKLVVLGDYKNQDADIVISKPFLPKEIEEVLNSSNFEIREKEPVKTNVLDPLEIERIKELMALDDIATSQTEEINYIDLLKSKDDFKLKKKEAKEFLKEITTLNKKELKRLLKGAKVSIKISFKKSEDE